MYDWPTFIDVMWLVLGLLPLGLVLTRVRKRGISEFASLAFFFVVITWTGYHSTPWLALRTNGWDSFMLRADHIIDGLIFSTLAMAAFLKGYGKTNQRGAESSESLRLRQILSSYRPNPILILGISLLSLTLFTINVGGPGELWVASYLRGEGQFEQSTEAKILNASIILGQFIYIGLALISSIAMFSANKKIGPVVRLIGIFGIVVSTLPMMHKFSRATGYVLILAAVVGILLRGWKKMFLVTLLLVVIAAWLSWVGYTQRGMLHPGVGSFLVALFDLQEPTIEQKNDDDSLWDNPGINPLNAMDAFTTRAWTRHFGEPPDLIEGTVGLIAALQPLPSHLMPFSVHAGEDLSVVLGTWGHTGLTTPALAELYYWFGFLGAVFLYPFGRMCRWIDRHRQQDGSIMYFILWIGTLFGFVVGLHSGVRAMTRLTLYGLVLMGIFHMVRRTRRKSIYIMSTH